MPTASGLLLAVVPDLFAGDIFAMKGGTAINLVVQNMAASLTLHAGVTCKSNQRKELERLCRCIKVANSVVNTVQVKHVKVRVQIKI
ncbi:MAG: hypothetical protein O2780_09755 [Proteobacteria bacterium]|nr:hypothetical protein [Pseudomonadota bacterium]MDA1298568.1 hypothetical protein [Pseudomonadota bacterium]